MNPSAHAPMNPSAHVPMKPCIERTLSGPNERREGVNRRLEKPNAMNPPVHTPMNP